MAALTMAIAVIVTVAAKPMVARVIRVVMDDPPGLMGMT